MDALDRLIASQQALLDLLIQIDAEAQRHHEELMKILKGDDQ